MDKFISTFIILASFYCSVLPGHSEVADLHHLMFINQTVSGCLDSRTFKDHIPQKKGETKVKFNSQ